jgi:hypothetical protein
VAGAGLPVTAGTGKFLFNSTDSINNEEFLMKNITLILIALATAALVGCSKPEEGPAEKAGKQIDESVEKAESYAEEKKKELGEALEKTGEDMQKED